MYPYTSAQVTHKLDSLQQEVDLLREREYPRTWGELLGEFMGLPGLIGFWPMSSVDLSSGDIYDISAQSRRMTRNGNTQLNYLANGTVPYCAFDGSGDYQTRADEPDLHVAGNETYFATDVRGLTLGGWFRQNTLTGSQGLLGRFVASGNQRAYMLHSNAGVITLTISSNGTATEDHAGATVGTGEWFWATGAWKPSTEGVVTVNGDRGVLTSSAVATLFGATAPFRIGDRGDSLAFLNGDATLCFLCGQYLTQRRIDRLYALSRIFFEA